MQKLGKNHGRYHGETIAIHPILDEVAAIAAAHGWLRERFLSSGELNLCALKRPASAATRAAHPAPRVYISAGIHGDEPAGPLAIHRLLRENLWPDDLSTWICPCLNPSGFVRNTRENADGVDLNRDYRHLETAEVRAHAAWLQEQPGFDLTLCLHEDWEAHGFYVYELNPEHRPSMAERITEAVAAVCPLDLSPTIDGHVAEAGIIRPDLDPTKRPRWAEAFYLIQNKTRQSCTLEAPSDFPMETRVNALVAAVRAAVRRLRAA